MAKLKVKKASNRVKKYMVYLRIIEMCNVASFSSFGDKLGEIGFFSTVCTDARTCARARVGIHSAEKANPVSK